MSRRKGALALRFQSSHRFVSTSISPFLLATSIAHRLWWPFFSTCVENRSTKRSYRRSIKNVDGCSLSLLGRTCARDENTQHDNRDIKIMKQILREIGGADAGTMRTSIASSTLLHCIALRLIYGSVINYRAVNAPQGFFSRCCVGRPRIFYTVLIISIHSMRIE